MIAQRMQKLEPPDTHYLSAAVGWMELGDLVESEKELNRVSAAQQCHPDVLEVRWLLLAQSQRWQPALEIARTLVKVAPERSSGWLHQAYALRRAAEDGLQQAWEALLPASSKFPKEPTIPYNLSCYACQLNQLEEAMTWFRRALLVGDRDQIKRMALCDPDLEPLWAEIRKV